MQPYSNDGLKPQSKPSPTSCVVLVVSGIGHIPSKKNHHFPLPNGGLAIDKEIKARMALLENAILFALYSAWQTIEKETPTGCSLRSWIACSVPEDDCWQAIPEIQVSVIKTKTPELTIEIVPL